MPGTCEVLELDLLGMSPRDSPLQTLKGWGLEYIHGWGVGAIRAEVGYVVGTLGVGGRVDG